MTKERDMRVGIPGADLMGTGSPERFSRSLGTKSCSATREQRLFPDGNMPACSRVGSRRNGTFALVRPGCRDRFLSGIRRTRVTMYLLSIRSSTNPNSGKELSMTSTKDKGIIDTPSNHSVDETVEKVKSILQARGVTVFALVDHSGEAEKVGMKMPPTKLLIFGNPKGGTPVMLAAPSIAIDLPLKILVWEDGQGKVWLSHNSPTYLQERHGVPQNLLPNIAVVGAVATMAGE
jgi:uncharacterized protein (DUF302 family)